MTREYETLFAENFSFWEHLTEDQKDMLCRSATLATYPKGVNLHNGSEECAVSASAFHKLVTENVYVEACGYHMATDRFSDVMWAMQQILFMAMDKRLAIFLTDEMSKTKSDKIHMTQEQIAKYMGTAREVVTRMIKYFAEEGIVETFRGGSRILDKKKLRSYL